MLAIAGQTAAGPIWLTFLEETHEYLGGKIG